jgi:hypothetical protein
MQSDSSVSGGRQATVPGNCRGLAGARLLAFAAVAIQFGLITLLVPHWKLENLTFARLLQLAFVGFIVHHLLPFRFRLPFFAVFSLASIFIVSVPWLGVLAGKVPLLDLLGRLVPGATLVGIGLVLIGVCHLPIPFAARILVLVAVGGSLAVLRANAHWVPALSDIWIILGSMFVFRIMVYLYDLKHRTAPFGFWRSIAYFFMVPNVCFPLFPLVDYKTFNATYYNEDWNRIYQTGVHWMYRGVFHLLLYRLVYQLAPLDVAGLSSNLDVAGFMVGTYLLYLRVSGQFHLIVGLLHMFGFNLPETHHLYFLASSFTDFWRRINIYWKDFIMKLFFYPSFFALRSRGPLKAMALATLVTFFLTWLLHSWQWFWIRGNFLFTWQDISFWAILAGLVLVNALYEATTPRKRTLAAARVSLGARAITGLQTLGTFLAICALWTLWSSQSAEELQALTDALTAPSVRDLAILVGGMLAIVVSGMIWGRSSRDSSEGGTTKATRTPFNFWRSVATVSVGTACLLAIPALSVHGGPRVEHLVAALRGEQLNARDMAQQRRGYYEELDEAQVNHRKWRNIETPKGWHDGRAAILRERPDFLMSENAPSVTTILSGAPATTNPLGLRDRLYDPDKPPGTYRLVLLGASHELGTGVKDDETFENLVEDRLNRENRPQGPAKYEILNLAVPASSLFQKQRRLEQVGFEFKPDAVLFCIYAVDREFVAGHLAQVFRTGVEIPPGYREFLTDIARRAGIRGSMPKLVIQRRLQPFMPELIEWVLRRFKSECEARGVRPILVYRPGPVDRPDLENAGRRELLGPASSLGLKVIDLSPAFEGIEDRRSIYLAEWDEHTNARGHRLLADTLYPQLAPLRGAGTGGIEAGAQ